MNRRLLLAILTLAACKGGGAADDSPRLTAALMPPGADGLVLGASTEDQVKAKLPGAEVKRDKTLGGDPKQTVMTNDHPAVVMTAPDAEMTLWADHGGTLRLMQMELRGAGRCDWVKAKIAPLPGAERCPGNRVTGDRGGEMYFCLATADGSQLVTVDCRRRSGPRGDDLELWVFDRR